MINAELLLHGTADGTVEVAMKSIISAVSFLPLIQKTVPSVCKCTFPTLLSILPSKESGIPAGTRLEDERQGEVGQSQRTSSRKQDGLQIIGR